MFVEPWQLMGPLSIPPDDTWVNMDRQWNDIDGTKSFIALLTRGHCQSLLWARLIQSTPSNLVSLRSILTLCFHLWLGLQNCLIPSDFPSKPVYTFFIFPIPAYLILHYLVKREIMKLLIIHLSQSSCHFPPHMSKYSQHPLLRHPISVCPSVPEAKFHTHT